MPKIISPINISFDPGVAKISDPVDCTKELPDKISTISNSTLSSKLHDPPATSNPPAKARPSLWSQAEAWEWIKNYPVKLNANGKVKTLSVARLIIRGKRPLLKTGIRWKSIAEHFGVPINSLNTYISALTKEKKPIEPLSDAQKNWLNKTMRNSGLPDYFSLPVLANFYLQQQSELIQRHITLAQLAEHNGKSPESLRKRINEAKNRIDNVKIDRKAYAFAWLDNNGLHKKYRGKITATVLARYHFENIDILKSKHIYISYLSDYYNVSQMNLYSAILKLKKISQPAKLDAGKEAWLKQHAPSRELKGRLLNLKLAEYYLKNKSLLKHHSITQDDLGIYYGCQTRKIVLCAMRLKKKPQSVPTLTVIETFWFEQKILSHCHNNPCSIAEYRQQNADSFDNELACFRNLQQTPVSQLPASARNVLDKLPLSSKATSVDLAKYYLENIIRFTEMGINHQIMAEFLKLTATTFIRQVRRQIASSPSPASTALPVKQEPASDCDNDVELWYRPRPFNNLPILLCPEDEEIALGHALGPLREKLTEVNIDKLRISRCPEYPALLSRRELRTAATSRLKKMVSAACEGTLLQLIRDEGYYHLMVDEQYPELGMGLYASKTIPEGLVLGIYPGVTYDSYQEYLQASQTVDSSFASFAFESAARRPPRKTEGAKKRAVRLTHGIGGHVQSGPLAFVNTAMVTDTGHVVGSEKNNLAAVIADKQIVAFVTKRIIKTGEPLLLNYGKKFRAQLKPRIKTEPPDE